MKNEAGNNKPVRGFKRVWDAMGVWLVCILLFAVLSIASDVFLTARNLTNIIRQIAATGIVALGSTFIVLAGEIDLSQGGVVAFIACAAAYFIMKRDIHPVFAVLISILIGALVMAILGSVVAYLKVPSFIATLGLAYIMEGAVLLLTNSKPIPNLPKGFTDVARGYIGGAIPIAAVILFSAFIVGAFILKYTKFGRNVVAVGENKRTAAMSGINVPFVKIAAFAIGGICSSLGAIILAARLGSGQPSSGADVSLMALAAVFVGGAGRGRGGVIDTLAGALIIGMINNGLNNIGLPAAWKNIALGAIIIIAVVLDVVRSRKASGSWR